eukprot:TRINITY_DN9810_c1_g1_i1.p1 TRINITY_DN9810_c1_g1~~TRINITY_DN9810_c1_g1_i1.p1  ORF type:complete len:186 (+),score=42.13 TRINITY_DN9810_c1_g1_i1:311-868(+)
MWWRRWPSLIFALLAATSVLPAAGRARAEQGGEGLRRKKHAGAPRHKQQHGHHVELSQARHRHHRLQLSQVDRVKHRHGVRRLRRRRRVNVDDLKTAAHAQLRKVEQVAAETDELHINSKAEGEMLQTQMLSGSTSLQVVRKMAQTVEQMKKHLTLLESKEKLCRQRLSDLKEQAAVAADTLPAR